MRLAADGRGQKEIKISSNFIKLNAALNAAERQARSELDERNKQIRESAINELKLSEELQQKKVETILKEQVRISSQKTENIYFLKDDNSSKSQFQNKTENLRDIASDEGNYERDILRDAIKKKLEREMRQNRMGKEKALIAREKERDIHEKLALGKTIENPIDELVMAEEGGINTGFRDEEEYDLYEKPLFAGEKRVNIYAGVKNITLEDQFESSNLPRNKKESETHKTRVLRTKPVEFHKYTKKE